MFGNTGREIKSLEMLLDQLKIEHDLMKGELAFLQDNQVHLNQKMTRSVYDVVCVDCECIMMGLPSLKLEDDDGYRCCRCTAQLKREGVLT